MLPDNLFGYIQHIGIHRPTKQDDPVNLEDEKRRLRPGNKTRKGLGELRATRCLKSEGERNLQLLRLLRRGHRYTPA